MQRTHSEHRLHSVCSIEERDLQLHLRKLLVQVLELLLSASARSMAGVHASAVALLGQGTEVASFSASDAAEIQLLSWLTEAQVSCCGRMLPNYMLSSRQSFK